MKEKLLSLSVELSLPLQSEFSGADGQEKACDYNTPLSGGGRIWSGAVWETRHSVGTPGPEYLDPIKCQSDASTRSVASRTAIFGRSVIADRGEIEAAEKPHGGKPDVHNIGAAAIPAGSLHLNHAPSTQYCDSNARYVVLSLTCSMPEKPPVFHEATK